MVPGLISRALAVLLALLACSPAWAQPVQPRLTQVHVNLPQIRLYVGMRDVTDAVAEPGGAQDFEVHLDGQALAPAIVEPFAGPVAYTVLVDISRSMAGRPFTMAREHIGGFLDAMGPDDRLMLMSFGDEVGVLSGFGDGRDATRRALDETRPKDDITVLFKALDRALEVNKGLDPALPARRAVILITDGKDEGSGITLDDLLGKIEAVGVPVYCIGYTRIDPGYMAGLKRIATLSGGMFIDGTDSGLGRTPFEVVTDGIRKETEIVLDHPVAPDASVHRLQVLYKTGQSVLSTEKSVAFLYGEKPAPAPAPVTESPDQTMIIALAGGGGGLLVVILVVVLVVRSKRARARAEEERLKAEQEAQARAEAEAAAAAQAEDDGDTQWLDEPPQTPEPQRPPNAELIVIKGVQEGRVYPLCVTAEGLEIGGDAAATLEDEDVAPRHCVLFSSGRYFQVQGLDGGQPTFLNGIPVGERTVLEDGDEIGLGKTRLRFRVL